MNGLSYVGRLSKWQRKTSLVFPCFISKEVQVIWLQSYVSKYISHNMSQWNLDYLLQMSLQPIRAAIFHKGFCVTFPQRFLCSFPLTKVGVSLDIISLFKVWPGHVRRATIKSNNITFISFSFISYNLGQVLWSETVKNVHVCLLQWSTTTFFNCIGQVWWIV